MKLAHLKDYLFISGATSKNGWKALIILIVGFVLTFVIASVVRREVEIQAGQEYASVCNEIKLKILTRLHAHAQLLRTGSAFFASSDSITRKEWEIFNERSKIEKNLPGIQGIGFAMVIPKNQLQQHIQSTRREGFPDYSVRPDGDRPVYSSIIYLEPFSGRNLRAFGYDMFSDPVRKKAMELSRDSDVAMLSGKVILVQETENDVQIGTLMYVPVYKRNVPVLTLEQRRAAIKGWVYSPYRMNDLMTGILGRWDLMRQERIHLQIYDDTVAVNALLFNSQGADKIKHKDLLTRSISDPIEFNGKRWILFFTQSREQTPFLSSKVVIVLFGGFAISLLLFALSISLFNTRDQAQRIAQQLTRALKKSEERFKILLNSTAEAIYGLDNKGNCTFSNTACSRLLGFQGSEQLIGKNMHDLIHHTYADGSHFDKKDCRIYKSFLSGEGTHVDDEVLWRADGTCFPSEYWSYPIFINGEIEGSVVTFFDITERKQAENELKQLSTRLTLAARAGGVGVWDLDIVNNILVWDDQMFKLYGINKKDFIGAYESWLAGIHPDDLEQGNAQIQMAIRGEKEFDIEFRVVWPDGTIRNIRALAIVERDINGKPLNLIGTNWDITTQKQAEMILVQTRRNYETFFNTIDDFLFVLDVQGNIIYTNDTVNHRLGYSNSELMSQSVLMVHPEERRNEAGRIVGEMLAGTADFCPVPLITKGGTLIPVETRVKPGFWDGKPVIFGVSKDVSKIKLSEEKFSKAFQSNSALMAISGFEDGIYMDVNDTFLATIGYSRDEIIGQTSEYLQLFVDLEVRASMIELLNLKLPVREVELEIRTRSGEIIIGLFSADNIFIGEKPCLLTVMVDITDRKRAEEESIKARSEAEKANLAKSEFLSRMSHELRTPMNSILGFAQLLELGDLKPGERKSVNHILNSGTHLLNLINEVLDIAQIESGKISLSMEPVQLNGMILEMMAVVRPHANSRRLNFELISSPDNLLFVKSDRQRLKQVLLNLLNNAIKYNREEGSVLIQISQQPADKNGFSPLRISISDTGYGISEEDISKLYRPFERIGADKTKTEGTGLGLAVVKKLMDAMGGRIGVDSQPGEGSTFWIELPQSSSPVENVEDDKGLKGLDFILNDKTGTILYIEDNFSNIELVEQILLSQRSGICLITNTDGRQAVNLAIEFTPDLILLDLNLPDIHGSEVMQLLQQEKRTRDIPVVIISADAMPQQLEKLIKAGAKSYLTKPLDLLAFLQVVDQWIGKNEIPGPQRTA